MNRVLLAAFVLTFAIPYVGMADDEDKAIKVLSTLTPADGKYEEIGMIAFYQSKETSVFGSDAEATLEAAITALQEKGKEAGADMIVGVTITPIATGDPGMIVCGTAIKLIK